jgi:hypothetical protein
MLLAFLLGGDALFANAAPTPIPGGANHVAEESATMRQTLHGETPNVRSTPLKEAGPNDHVEVAEA